MYRDFQARLGIKQDLIRRKLLDNNLELTGAPTDCIRIRVTKNDEGDKTSSTVERADVVNINFPPMIDVPYRYIKKTDSSTKPSYQITSLVSATTEDQQKAYELSVPHSAFLEVGDTIIRVLQDNEQALPIVIATEITEMLGTFGFGAMIQHKYKSVITMEEIPEQILLVIAELAQRRLKIRF